MKILAILIVFLHCASSEISFEEWQEKFNVTYPNATEAEMRRKIFEENLQFIQTFNSMKAMNYKMGVNSFFDGNFEEFKCNRLGLKVGETRQKVTVYDPSANKTAYQVVGLMGSYSPHTAPASVDYRKYTLPIEDQGNCGSCWAYAVIGTLESRMKILNPSFSTSLSKQILVDCDYHSDGCSGGWSLPALDYIVQEKGNSVPTTSDYPYQAQDSWCKTTPMIPMNIKATLQIRLDGNENLLKRIVANIGPVTVYIQVTRNFLYYESGIFYDPKTNGNCVSINHAVVIVGYGRDPKTREDYWLVRNSWGIEWGSDGHIYVARNRNNNINIACFAIYAI